MKSKKNINKEKVNMSKKKNLTRDNHYELLSSIVMNYDDKIKDAMRFIIKRRKAQQDFILKKIEEYNITKTCLKKAAHYYKSDLIDRLKYGILDLELLERVEIALFIIILEIDLDREKEGNRASQHFDRHECLNKYLRDKEEWERNFHLSPCYMGYEELEDFCNALSMCYCILRGYTGSAKLSFLRRLDEKNEK